METKISATLVAACVGTILIAVTVMGQEREFNPRTVIRRPFPVIVDAPVMDAATANRKLHSNELVLGVVVDGTARAYPINMLTGPSREIINDSLGDRAIAATW